MNESKTKPDRNEEHTLVIYNNEGEPSRQENFGKESQRAINIHKKEVIEKKRKIALDEYDSGTKFTQLPDLEKGLRLIFLRKLWGIFTLQLVITYGLMCLAYITKIRNLFFPDTELNQIILLAMLLVLCAMLLVLFCLQRFTKKVPVNYILFILWTLVESFMLMVSHIRLNTDPQNLNPTKSQDNTMNLLSIFGMIVGISIGMTLYCCMIKTKFNYFVAMIVCIVSIFVVALLFMIPIFISNQGGDFKPIFYGALTLLGLALYFVSDTWINLNKIRTKYKLEDYLIAALNMYIDPINVLAYVVTWIEY